jgi:uncharacterized lipoprotein
MRWLVWISLVLLVLAGCSSNGGNGEQDGNDQDADAGGAEPGADPGTCQDP